MSLNLSQWTEHYLISSEIWLGIWSEKIWDLHWSEIWSKKISDLIWYWKVTHHRKFKWFFPARLYRATGILSSISHRICFVLFSGGSDPATPTTPGLPTGTFPSSSPCKVMLMKDYLIIHSNNNETDPICQTRYRMVVRVIIFVFRIQYSLLRGPCTNECGSWINHYMLYHHCMYHLPRYIAVIVRTAHVWRPLSHGCSMNFINLFCYSLLLPW